MNAIDSTSEFSLELDQIIHAALSHSHLPLIQDNMKNENVKHEHVPFQLNQEQEQEQLIGKVYLYDCELKLKIDGCITRKN